jgi:two-component sensor histidine kinase
LAIVLVAIGVRLAAQDLFVGYPFITLFPAVVLAAYLGGTGPGVLALALGGAGACYFLVQPPHSFALTSPSEVIGLAAYLVFGAFIVRAVRALAAATERERAARLDLARAVDEKDRFLRERELLLTEIRHRVGNNLQQITGLLMLHARRIGDPVAHEAFNQAAARVSLFAEVHRSLYRADDDRVELDDVLTRLATRLVAAHRPVGIACRVEVAPGFVWPPDRAVPLVMVVHELVCNALEHGFGDDGVGAIAVSLDRTPTGLVRLTVADDGRGLPPGVDAERADNLGLSIVRAFARQLGASFRLHAGEDGRGTVAELLFDDPPTSRDGSPGQEVKDAAA